MLGKRSVPSSGHPPPAVQIGLRLLCPQIVCVDKDVFQDGGGSADKSVSEVAAEEEVVVGGSWEHTAPRGCTWRPVDLHAQALCGQA